MIIIFLFRWIHYFNVILCIPVVPNTKKLSFSLFNNYNNSVTVCVKLKSIMFYSFFFRLMNTFLGKRSYFFFFQVSISGRFHDNLVNKKKYLVCVVRLLCHARPAENTSQVHQEVDEWRRKHSHAPVVTRYMCTLYIYNVRIFIYLFIY